VSAASRGEEIGGEEAQKDAGADPPAPAAHGGGCADSEGPRGTRRSIQPSTHDWLMTSARAGTPWCDAERGGDHDVCIRLSSGVSQRVLVMNVRKLYRGSLRDIFFRSAEGCADGSEKMRKEKCGKKY
jgi:hypothetical protein